MKIMVKENIFKGAKLGDKFLTRDGNIAIYFANSGDLKECVILEYNGIYEYDEYGKDLYETYDLPSDIISRYEESIDEKKLDELTLEYVNKVWMNSNFTSLDEVPDEMDGIQNTICDFKAGLKTIIEKCGYETENI